MDGMQTMGLPSGDVSIVAAGLLLVVCMSLWASGLAAEIVTAMLFLTVAMLLRLAPPATVFSGFASSALWLVLGGIVVGLAMTRTGLGDRLARSLSGRLSGSYPRFIAGIVLLSFVLSFVMPSNLGQIALLIPVVLAPCDTFGLEPGRPGRFEAAMAVGLATPLLSTVILPVNVPNLVMAGKAETQHGLQIAYLPYLLLHAPVLALVKGVFLVIVGLSLVARIGAARVTGMPTMRPSRTGGARNAACTLVRCGYQLRDVPGSPGSCIANRGF